MAGVRGTSPAAGGGVHWELIRGLLRRLFSSCLCELEAVTQPLCAPFPLLEDGNKYHLPLTTDFRWGASPVCVMHLSVRPSQETRCRNTGLWQGGGWWRDSSCS